MKRNKFRDPKRDCPKTQHNSPKIGASAKAPNIEDERKIIAHCDCHDHRHDQGQASAATQGHDRPGPKSKVLSRLWKNNFVIV